MNRNLLVFLTVTALIAQTQQQTNATTNTTTLNLGVEVNLASTLTGTCPGYKANAVCVADTKNECLWTHDMCLSLDQAKTHCIGQITEAKCDAPCAWGTPKATVTVDVDATAVAVNATATATATSVTNAASSLSSCYFNEDSLNANVVQVAGALVMVALLAF